MWRIYQLYLGQFQIDARWFAVFYFAFHTVVFTSHWYLDQIEGSIGSIPLLRWSVVVALVGLFIAVLFPNPIWIFCGSLIALIASSFREPVFSHAMNQRIKSRSRATTLSNLYVLKAILDIPLLFLAGFLALRDPRLVYIVCILLCLGVLLFVPVRERDILVVPTAEEGGESF